MMKRAWSFALGLAVLAAADVAAQQPAAPSPAGTVAPVVETEPESEPTQRFPGGTIPADQPPADDCAWQFGGKVRKAVKLRDAGSGASYTNFNNGAPISVPEWIKMTCTLDGKVPAKVPAKSAIPGVETVKVTLRGFLLAARFELVGDHDIHAEIGETADWSTPHVIVECPPGADFCDGRKVLWGLVLKDIQSTHADPRTTLHILEKPVAVEVTGYVFLDSGHAAHGSTNFCSENGGRGIQKPGAGGSKVAGLWEIHPVMSVKEVGQ